MNHTVTAVFYNDIMIRSVIRILVSPDTLTTFQHDGIIIDRHITSVNEDIITIINIYSIAARSFHPCSRSINVYVEVFYTLAAIDMIRPEATVNGTYAADSNILAIRDIEQTRTHSLEVCAVFVDLTTDPELTPETQSIAIDGSFAGYGKAIKTVGIDKSRKIIQGLTFHTCLSYFIILYIISSLDSSAFRDIKMSSLFEKQTTCKECSLGYDNNSSSVICDPIDDILNGSRLNDCTVVLHTIFGNDILFTKCIDVHISCIAKPRRYRGPVRE